MNIIARHHEQRILDAILQSCVPEFLAVYGRRRVGKTFLIQQHFKSQGLYFELTGVYQAKLQQQLQNFSWALGDGFMQGQPVATPSSWLEAFNLLRKAIAASDTDRRIILFFDELPWLATQKSGFLAALEHFWNRYASQDSRVILIVCGSAASWMIKHIVHNRGGLHGRLTRKLKLEPYNLAQTKQFLQEKHIHLDHKQIIELYMALGGIPKYLNLLERGKSAAQQINDICFQPNGFLLNEFNTIFHSLFKHAERHIAIVRVLASRTYGLDQNMLLEQAGLVSGGTSSLILKELEEAGFIIRLPQFGKGKNKQRFKLIDAYSLFYLKWIEPGLQNSLSQIDQDYWLKMQITQSWKAWAGYAFENICLTHIAQIKTALGLKAVSTQHSCGWNGLNHTSQQAQIDLIIDRNDHCISLCEIKFHRGEVMIDKAMYENLENKKQAFLNKTQTKKTVLMAFITAFGVKENDYYNMAISAQVVADDLFVVKE